MIGIFTLTLNQPVAALLVEAEGFHRRRKFLATGLSVAVNWATSLVACWLVADGRTTTAAVLAFVGWHLAFAFDCSMAALLGNTI